MNRTVCQAIESMMREPLGLPWWTPTEIRKGLERRGIFCTSFLERLRQLRGELRRSGEGDILMRPKPGRPKGSRVCEYRLLLTAQEGQDRESYTDNQDRKTYAARERRA